MAREREQITVAQLDFLDVNSGTRARVIGDTDGFWLEITHKNRKFELTTARGGRKRYRSLNTVAMVLRDLEFGEFKVDVREYEPGVRNRRQDVSARLRSIRA
jgi:hypothetical protein